MTQPQYPGHTVLGTYAYDGAGHRVSKTESATTTKSSIQRLRAQ
jgi:YD repeat-containing protein